MTRGSNFAKKNNRINLTAFLGMLKNVHPQVCSIIEQVRNSTQISESDKSMIEDQLIAMCGTLNSAKKYGLYMGRWTKDSVYSEKRAQVVRDKNPIRDETVFTIVPCGKRLHWVAYIDLPIDVKV